MFSEFYQDYKRQSYLYEHPRNYYVWIALMIFSIGTAVLTQIMNCCIWCMIFFLALGVIFFALAICINIRQYKTTDFSAAQLAKQERVQTLIEKYAKAYNLTSAEVIDLLINAAEIRLQNREKENTTMSALLILFPAALSSTISLIPDELKTRTFFEIIMGLLLLAIILFVLILIIESQMFDIFVKSKHRSYIYLIEDLSIIRKNQSPIKKSNKSEGESA